MMLRNLVKVKDNKEFNDIDEALKWMRESYIRDAEIKLNIKQN